MTTPLLLVVAGAIFLAAAALIGLNTRRGLRFREHAPTVINTVLPALAGGAVSAGLALPALLAGHPLLALAWATMSAALLANVVTDLIDHDVWLDVIFGATAVVLILATGDALLAGGKRSPVDAFLGLVVLGGLSYALQRGATLWARLRGLQFEEGDEDSDYGFGDTAAWLLIGAGLGWQLGFMAFFASAMIHGLLIAVPVMIWNLVTRRGWFSTHVPMLPAIAFATCLALAVAGGLIDLSVLGL